MVDQCREYLSFNEKMLQRMLEKGDFKEPVGAQAKMRREERVRKARSWGLAELHDSMESLIFKMGGSMTRTPGRYIFKARHLIHGKTSSRPPHRTSSGGS